jgi:hypothetical protein
LASASLSVLVAFAGVVSGRDTIRPVLAGGAGRDFLPNGNFAVAWDERGSGKSDVEALLSAAVRSLPSERLNSTYSGVVHLPDGVTLTGTAQVTATANGGFSAKIASMGKTFTFSGKLDAVGHYSGFGSTKVSLGGVSFTVNGIKVTLDTVKDATGTWMQVTGTVGDVVVTAELRKAA